MNTTPHAFAQVSITQIQLPHFALLPTFDTITTMLKVLCDTIRQRDISERVVVNKIRDYVQQGSSLVPVVPDAGGEDIFLAIVQRGFVNAFDVVVEQMMRLPGMQTTKDIPKHMIKRADLFFVAMAHADPIALAICTRLTSMGISSFCLLNDTSPFCEACSKGLYYTAVYLFREAMFGLITTASWIWRKRTAGGGSGSRSGSGTESSSGGRAGSGSGSGSGGRSGGGTESRTGGRTGSGTGSGVAAAAGDHTKLGVRARRWIRMQMRSVAYNKTTRASCLQYAALAGNFSLCKFLLSDECLVIWPRSNRQLFLRHTADPKTPRACFNTPALFCAVTPFALPLVEYLIDIYRDKDDNAKASLLFRVLSHASQLAAGRKYIPDAFEYNMRLVELLFRKVAELPQFTDTWKLDDYLIVVAKWNNKAQSRSKVNEPSDYQQDLRIANTIRLLIKRHGISTKTCVSSLVANSERTLCWYETMPDYGPSPVSVTILLDWLPPKVANVRGILGTHFRFDHRVITHYLDRILAARNYYPAMSQYYADSPSTLSTILRSALLLDHSSALSVVKLVAGDPFVEGAVAGVVEGLVSRSFLTDNEARFLLWARNNLHYDNIDPEKLIHQAPEHMQTALFNHVRVASKESTAHLRHICENTSTGLMCATVWYSSSQVSLTRIYARLFFVSCKRDLHLARYTRTQMNHAYWMRHMLKEKDGARICVWPKAGAGAGAGAVHATTTASPVLPLNASDTILSYLYFGPLDLPVHLPYLDRLDMAHLTSRHTTAHDDLDPAAEPPFDVMD